MTPDEAATLIRSIEARAIEHTLLLTMIAKAAVLTAVCAVLITLIVLFR